MTAEQWKKIEAVIETGDPVKDVADEQDLLLYVLELRAAISKNLPALERMAAQIICPSDNVFARIVESLKGAMHHY